MWLSIVFPAYDEEANIGAAVGDALAYLGDRDGEVVVVNDGSRDRTGEILDELARRHPGRVRPIHHASNQGYAAALRDGFLASRGDWIFYTDADRQFVLRELDTLLLHSPEADLIVGYRRHRKDPPLRRFAAWGYNRLICLCFGLRGVRDIDCAFKLFRRGVFRKLEIRSAHFVVDAEVLVKAQRAGLRIREVGVTHLPRRAGHSTVGPGHILQTLADLRDLARDLRSTPPL
jgi:glycosyltransferase involved in cell wall biosynthesis